MACSNTNDAILTISKSAEYGSRLLDVMKDMQKSSELTDFCIKVDGVAIGVHRCVLSAACDYFRTMFNSGMKEVKEGVVHLHTMDCDVVTTVVDYIYGQEITIEWINIKAYLDVAERFQLIDLKRMIEDYIIDHIVPDNCMEWYSVAERYQMKQLKSKSRKVLTYNFVKASSCEGFRRLSLVEITELLSDDLIASGNCDRIVQACIEWIFADEQSRRECFGELLQHIAIERCSPDYLQFILESYINVIILDMDVYAQITQGLLASMSMCDARPRKSLRPDIRSGLASNITCSSVLVLCGQSSITTLNKNMYTMDFQAECEEDDAVYDLGTAPDVLQRFFPALCSTPYGVFLAGGGIQCLPSTATSDCCLYDVETGKLTCLPCLPSPVYAARATAIGSKVFLVGGFGTENRMLSLDLEDKTWNRCMQLPHKTQCPLVCSVGPEVFVLAKNAETDGISLQCYDVANNVWHEKSPPPPEIMDTSGACAITVDEEDVYIVGGDGKLCAQYSTAVDRWGVRAKPKYSHGYGGAVYLDGKIYLMGGRDRGQYSAVVEVYDIQANRWEDSTIKLPLSLLDLFCSTGSS